MTKKIIIGLAIGVPVLVGIYLYRKNKTTARRTRTRNNPNSGTSSEPVVSGRQQIYNLQQGQILREKIVAGGILKQSEIPN
jgi:hypothetical protein